MAALRGKNRPAQFVSVVKSVAYDRAGRWWIVSDNQVLKRQHRRKLEANPGGACTIPSSGDSSAERGCGIAQRARVCPAGLTVPKLDRRRVHTAFSVRRQWVCYEPFRRHRGRTSALLRAAPILALQLYTNRSRLEAWQGIRRHVLSLRDGVVEERQSISDVVVDTPSAFLPVPRYREI